MASKTALNAANLEALGAARLAELAMELSQGDGAAQRRLRLELAAGQGAGEVARAVRRRLGQVARARGFVDWYRRRPLIDDLDAHRCAIVDDVAPQDPREALDLMWRFLALAGPVHERCDDSDGLVGDLFRDALADLGEIAATARPDPEGLAEQTFAALQDNGYAQYDGLVAALAPALGGPGLTHLETLLRAWAALPPGEPTGGDGAAERWGLGADGPSAKIAARASRHSADRARRHRRRPGRRRRLRGAVRRGRAPVAGDRGRYRAEAARGGARGRRADRARRR